MKTLIIMLYVFSQGLWAKTVHSGVSEGMKYTVEQVTRGHKIIWGMTFLDENRILFTERRGTLKLLYIPSGKVEKITGLPKDIKSSGQGGLLDIKVGPNYPKQPWIYFTYSKKLSGGSATTLAMASLKDNKLVEWRDLLVTKSQTTTHRHFGSRIAFDSEKKHVFFGIGDRGRRPNGQNLMTHAGSVLRLKLNGEVPKDNPFVGRKDILPEIWSYGHRNPQGLVFDQVNNRLWEMEHGPRGGDEINLITKGKNYGWATISHGKEYWGPVSVGESTSKNGMEQPVKYYLPSIAPCGLEVYSGKLFPKWKGNLFSGALKLEHLNRVVLNGVKATKEERLLEKLEWRIRSVVEGPKGNLYLSTDNGRILRLSPK
jgi:glucose/arabinose dehydrogenase